MTIDEKISHLVALCKGSVMITINEHRDSYESIREHCSRVNEDHPNKISPGRITDMEEAGVMYNVHAYPDTPVGFYSHYSHRLNDALEVVINAIEESRK